jgi:small-conductance mechanosensitive channel
MISTKAHTVWRALALAAMIAAPGWGAAQTTAPVAKPAPAPVTAQPAPSPLAMDEQTLAELRAQLPSVNRDDQLKLMASRAEAIEASGRQAMAAPQAQAAALEAQLRRIPVRRWPTAFERRERAALTAQLSAAQAQAAPWQALGDQAMQVYGQIAERRREGFSGRVLQRTPSPVSPQFWTLLGGALAGDLGRLDMLAGGAIATALAAREPRGIGGLALGLLVAVLLMWPARRLLENLGWRRARKLGSQGATRTLAVVWRVAVDIAAPVLAADAIRLGAQWAGLLSARADELAVAAVGAVAWAAAVLALGRALAAAGEADARPAPVADSQAARARVSLWVVALVTAGGFFLQRLSFLAGASLEATIAADYAVSLAYAAAAGLILASFGRRQGQGAGDPAARGPAWTLASLVLALAIATTLGAVLFGYATLAMLTSSQIFWLALICAVAWLALRLVDEVMGALFGDGGRATQTLRLVFGLSASTVEQAALLIAAGLQLLIILAAVVLALTPFGANGHLLAANLGALGGDIRIGKATISPAGVAGGLITLFVGIGLSHLVRRWVERRYLPVTHWDPGVRNSVAIGVGYLGVAIALICALAATGVGVAQIALVASALSVGVGFGLQQIVQNFVAGVILLIERPVKVGDWINVGGVEGDVLALRVRATDIRSLDGSTVIVPNSSLITTNVQNKTRIGAQSRIQLQVSVTRTADIRRACALILQVAGGRAEVLKTPAPQVFVDALTAGGGATLDAWLYIADPRAAVAMRSELYLAVLDAFEQAQIGM